MIDEIDDAILQTTYVEAIQYVHDEGSVIVRGCHRAALAFRNEASMDGADALTNDSSAGFAPPDCWSTAYTIITAESSPWPTRRDNAVYAFARKSLEVRRPFIQ